MYDPSTSRTDCARDWHLVGNRSRDRTTGCQRGVRHWQSPRAIRTHRSDGMPTRIETDVTDAEDTEARIDAAGAARRFPYHRGRGRRHNVERRRRRRPHPHAFSVNPRRRLRRLPGRSRRDETPSSDGAILYLSSVAGLNELPKSWLSANASGTLPELPVEPGPTTSGGIPASGRHRDGCPGRRTHRLDGRPIFHSDSTESRMR